METVKIKFRCKDCEYSEQVPNYKFFYCYYWDYEQGSEPNRVNGKDFCSYAEVIECEKK